MTHRKNILEEKNALTKMGRQNGCLKYVYYIVLETFVGFPFE